MDMLRLMNNLNFVELIHVKVIFRNKAHKILYIPKVNSLVTNSGYFCMSPLQCTPCLACCQIVLILNLNISSRPKEPLTVSLTFDMSYNIYSIFDISLISYIGTNIE